ncbi:hypothetical protein [Agrococcus sp. TSP3-2-1]|uniref:hypothetical protein n=1 Tax=Agrococcus sp. TSP3-2-1 TaxID=2804583 RepID=UPI003CED3DF5
MRQRRLLLLGSLMLTAGLSGCATDGVGSVGSAPSTPSPDASAAPVNVSSEASAAPAAGASAQQRADAWLAAAVLPPSAVSSPTMPDGAIVLEGSSQGWWCEPMGLATGYWTIPDMGVIETANWLTQHPTADLIVPVRITQAEDGSVDGATVGNVPTAGSLEGIAFTVARATDGVAVRAEVGAFGESTVCPTPAPGEAFGGPGQG